MKLRVFVFAILVAFFMAGCDKNSPANKFVNPVTNSTYSGNWSGEWVLYDNELKTNGTVMFFSSADGQELDLSCTDNPHSGSRCIRYSWDGSDVYTYSLGARQHDWCGFSLIAAETVAGYNSITKDLSPGGYTKLSFWARGSLNSGVNIRIEGNSGNEFSVLGTDMWTSGTLSSSWQPFEFNLTTSSVTAIKDFVKIIFKYDDGDINPSTHNKYNSNGGTVYLDDIKLTR